MERSDVYQHINKERLYQDLMWEEHNNENGIPDSKKSITDWINFMEFHLSKAKLYTNLNDNVNSLAEIRKVTALGVLTMEIHGCSEREFDVEEELLKIFAKETMKACMCGDGCGCDKKCK